MTKVKQWLAQFEALVDAGQSLTAPLPSPIPTQSTFSQPPGLPRGKCCLILSPHPDDECLMGALPLRLKREGGWRVVNLAVTHGSKPERQLERAKELTASCRVLGFENILLTERGLLRVSARSRAQDPLHWARCVAQVARQFDALRPDLIVCPHLQDAQAAHMGTHLLALDALASLSADSPVEASRFDYSPLVALTEYWSTMASPNLMLQLKADDVADLMSALMQHAGEISRNRYHLSLPAWMMDNVRRGAEQVGPPGSHAPGFRFAVLYRVMQWRGGALHPAWAGGQFADLAQCPDLTLSTVG